MSLVKKITFQIFQMGMKNFIPVWLKMLDLAGGYGMIPWVVGISQRSFRAGRNVGGGSGQGYWAPCREEFTLSPLPPLTKET